MIEDVLDETEIGALGLAAAGRGLRVSRHALLLAAERISIGDGTAIDAFATLSASSRGMVIGRNVRIGPYSTIVGQERVEIGDGATLEGRCAVFTSNDDYSGAALLTPTVPDRFRDARDAAVHVGPGAVLGVGTIVLPGVSIGAGASVAPFSMVTADVPDGGAVAGVPARPLPAS